MPTAVAPARLLDFRRRAVSVSAGVLAIGMVLLAVVLEVTNPTIVALDVVLLTATAAVHAAAARTVGRWWDPGGWVCLAYLVVVTLLISVSFVHAETPHSDAFWFLLVPVGLSAVTMSARPHAAVTAFGLASYVVLTPFGPGLDLPLTASRLVSMALFGLAMHAFARRLEQALVDADTAEAALADQLGEVQRLNQRLLELDQAKDGFVSTVSHELRTPLTVIMGLTETLDSRYEDLDPDRRREVASRIGANARGLEGIVATLLDLARIERGGLDPVPGPVLLRVATEESLARVGPLLQDHTVVVQVPEAIVVRTDARLLERVLDNLLVNASRHTAPGTSVHLRARPQGEVVRVEVADDGPGVSPDELARLGEQFYQAGDRTHDGTTDGIGLGLALVRDVLAALDSQLDISSEPGRGTTFSFELPVAADADGRLAGEAERSPDESPVPCGSGQSWPDLA